MALSDKKWIFIHHSLTADSGTVSWSAIRKYHVETNGWKDVGYHFGIEDVNGVVEVIMGRQLGATAAAVKEHNANRDGVHICIVGNFDHTSPPKQYWQKAVELSGLLCQLLHIPVKNILAHRDYAKYKSCPGTEFNMTLFRHDVQAWLSKQASQP